MSIRLKLKIRKVSSTLVVSIPNILSLLNKPTDEEAKEALWESFAGLKETQVPTVHDKQWLQNIIDWTPQEGLPLSEMAKWFRLAEHVNNIDETKEKDFTFSQFQVDLIWSRITNDEFKLARLDIAFLEFLKEFQAVTGKHFEQEEPEGTETA